MKINTETLLFEDLTTEEEKELLILVEKMILIGETPLRENKFVKLWMDTLQYDDRQFLLTMSIVFPQRALLSIKRN